MTSRTIGTGCDMGGLYMLLPQDNAIMSTTQLLALHQCHGHPSIKLMHLQFPQLSILAYFVCNSCQRAKHFISHHSHLVRSATTPFDLVHNNIWGLALFPYTHGHRYFATFIDDFSHATRLCLLKTSDKVFMKFKHPFNKKNSFHHYWGYWYYNVGHSQHNIGQVSIKWASWPVQRAM